MKDVRLKKQDELELVEKVRQEREYAFMTVINKRQQMREQDKLLNDVSNKDKIDLKTLFYLQKTLISLHYADNPTVKVFPNAQTLVGVEKAKNLERLIKHDSKVIRLSEMNFENQNNRFERGVAVRVNVGFDYDRMVPKWVVVDPRQWFPDPRGWFQRESFSFHGFEYTVQKWLLTEDDGYFDIDKAVAKESPQEMLNRYQAETSQKLNPFAMDRDPTCQSLGIYHHMTIFKGKKYFVSLANDCSTLVRLKEIPSIFESEISNPLLTPFPVALNYYHPIKYSPFGISLPDLLQDKHRYRNVLANLMFIKEKDMAVGDDVLFNPDMIRNANDLTKASITRKFIAATTHGEPLSNATSVIPKNPASQSTYNMVSQLDAWAQMAVSIDPRTMGISGGQAVTATESQQLQANNNLRTLFESKINNIGEVDFWKLHIRSYLENLGYSQKKVVRVTNSFGSQLKEFTKKDIITDTDPDIEIASKSETQAEIDKKKANLMPLFLATMNNPNASAAERTAAKRKILELNDVEDEELWQHASPSAEEIDAKELVPLLNMNVMEAAAIDPAKMDVDHATYISVFMTALPTEAREAAIRARKEAIIAMAQHKPAQTADSQNFNAMASSQMVGQAQRKQSDGVVSKDLNAA